MKVMRLAGWLWSRGLRTAVPPLSSWTASWEYDREMYKRHNEVARLFRCLKGFRRVFTRFGKLDVIFLSFIAPMLTDSTARCG